MKVKDILGEILARNKIKFKKNICYNFKLFNCCNH